MQIKTKRSLLPLFLMICLSFFACQNSKKASDNKSFNPEIKKQEWAIVLRNGAVLAEKTPQVASKRSKR